MTLSIFAVRQILSEQELDNQNRHENLITASFYNRRLKHYIDGFYEIPELVQRYQNNEYLPHNSIYSKSHHNPFRDNNSAVVSQIAWEKFLKKRRIGSYFTYETDTNHQSFEQDKNEQSTHQKTTQDSTNPLMKTCSQCHATDEVPYHDPGLLKDFISYSDHSVLEHLKGENGAKLMPIASSKITRKQKRKLIKYVEDLLKKTKEEGNENTTNK